MPRGQDTHNFALVAATFVCWGRGMLLHARLLADLKMCTNKDCADQLFKVSVLLGHGFSEVMGLLEPLAD